MATSGDPNQLKGIKPWKIPEKPVVARPDEESTFDSLTHCSILRYSQGLIFFTMPVASPPRTSFHLHSLI